MVCAEIAGADWSAQRTLRDYGALTGEEPGLSESSYSGKVRLDKSDGGGGILRTQFSKERTVCINRRSIVMFVVLIAAAMPCLGEGPGAWTGLCGRVNEDVICDGFSQPATCICDSTGLQCGFAHYCCGRGYHDAWTAPATVTSMPLPCPAIWSDPKPCGWRWKCRTNINGNDGESCLTSPGCSFSGTTDSDKVISTSMHPNLFEKGTCIPVTP